MGQKNSTNSMDRVKHVDPDITQTELEQLISVWRDFMSAIKNGNTKEKELRQLRNKFIDHLTSQGEVFIKDLNNEREKKLRQDEAKKLDSRIKLPDELKESIKSFLDAVNKHHSNRQQTQFTDQTQFNDQYMIKLFFMRKNERTTPRRFKHTYNAVKRMAVYVATEIKEKSEGLIPDIQKAVNTDFSSLYPVIDKYWKGECEIENRTEIVKAVKDDLELKEINHINDPFVLNSVNLEEVTQERKRQRTTDSGLFSLY